MAHLDPGGGGQLLGVASGINAPVRGLGHRERRVDRNNDGPEGKRGEGEVTHSRGVS